MTFLQLNKLLCEIILLPDLLLFELNQPQESLHLKLCIRQLILNPSDIELIVSKQLLLFL